MQEAATREQNEFIERKMQQLQDKQYRKKEKKQGATKSAPVATSKVEAIAIGSIVKIKGQTSAGKVLEINDKKATIVFGSIKTTVKLDRLEPSNANLLKAENLKSTFVCSGTHDRMYEKKLNFKQDLDVRGMRGGEAVQAVTYFVDDAILVGIERVRILHGTGNGILRSLIRQYLQTVSGIKHFADEHVQFGGAGITVVDLA
jgi:DNA mismatch repair protein MutS2